MCFKIAGRFNYCSTDYIYYHFNPCFCGIQGELQR